MSDGCYQLTPSASNRSGSVWSINRINLTEPFTVSGRINFGTTSWFSQGADGIAFALQRTTNTSTGTGAGMGVAWINPSLIVEFDTYQNGYDPNYDHIAINKHGDPDHNTGNNLAGPVQIINGNNNAQDGNWHDYRITWDPTTETITVDIDCQQRISWSGDVLQNIFNNDPNVYWGFSSATGNRFTYHQVCIDATNLFEIPDTAMCQGETIAIDLPLTGTNYSLGSWSPTTGIVNANAPTPTFSPSATTEYVVTYEGTCNEEETDTFTITVEDAPTVDLGNDTSVCGTAQVTLDAGNPGSTYSWSNGANSQTIDVGVGTYDVEVTSPTGCVGRDTIVISASGALSVSLGNDTNVCGAAQVTLDAGNAGSTYLWNTGATSQTINAPIGTYDVEVTAPSGCVGRDTIVISAGGGLVVDLGNDTAVCNGALVNLDAGHPGSTYSWNPTGTTAQTLNIGPGTIDVLVTSPTGCTGRDTIVISIGGGMSTDLGNDTSICGAVNLLLDAGNTGANYTWNTGATSQTLAASAIGTYYVDVELNGCTATDTIVISSGTGPAVTLPNDFSLCTGNDSVITASTTAANFLWNTGATADSITGSPGQTYSVEVWDDPACISRDTVVISTSASSTVSLPNDFSFCVGDSVTIVASPAGNLTWSTGSTADSITVNIGGTYWVEKDAGSACAARDSISILANAAVTVDLGPDQSSCSGTGINLTAGPPGLIYLWSTGETTRSISTNGKGQYWVELTTLSGCVRSDTINITAGNSLSVNLGPDSSICTGSISLDAGHPGSTYLWNTGATSQQISVSAAGTYDVLVTDGTGCEGRDTIVVSTGTAPIVNLGSDSSFCGAVNLNLDAGNAGSTYLWTGGSTNQTLAVNNAGTYIVEVTSPSGCTSSDTIIVSSTASNLTVDLGPDTSFCAPYNYTVNAGNPGASYSWSTGGTNQSINITAAGSYWVTVSNGSCSSSDTVIVSTSAAPALDLGPDDSVCEGETFTIDAGIPGATYTWSTAETSQSIDVTTSGTYSLDLSLNGCNASDDITITFVPLPIINITTSKPFPCDGDTITVSTGNNVDQHTWMDGSTALTYTTTTNHHVSVTVVNGAGCQSSDGLIVNFETVNIDINDAFYHCAGSSTTIGPNTTDNNLNYTWGSSGDNGDGTLTTEENGVHIINAVSQNLCGVSDTVELFSIDLPSITLSGDTAGCDGELLSIQATAPPGQISWSNGSSSSDIIVSDSGLYVATVTTLSNGLECSASDSINVHLYSYPTTYDEIVVKHCFEFDPVKVISANVSALNIDWEHSDAVGNTAAIMDEGTYTMFAYNHENCVSEQKFRVEEVCPVRYFVPNSFTPDGNGLNDHFSLNVKNVVNYELTIFNRWGEIVFTSNDPTESWNGTMNNEAVQEDVYVWRASYSGFDQDGRLSSKNLTGTVTVIR